MNTMLFKTGGIAVDPPLIVDYENSIHLGEDTEKPLKYFYAHTEEAAMDYIEASDIYFSAIFLNHEVKTCLNLIKRMHEKRAGTPIYVFEDEKHGHMNLESEKLAIHEKLKKPVDIGNILKLITPIIDDIEAIRTDDGGVTCEDYIAVPIENYLCGSKSFFDLFIRLSSGKYIKLLNKGDQFSIERLSPYLNKGVDRFYLRKDSLDEYVGYCDLILKKIESTELVSSEIKFSHSLHFSDVLLQRLNGMRVNPREIEFASNIVNSTLRLVENTKLIQNRDISAYMKDIVLKDHAIGTTILSALIMKPLGIESSKIQKLVGMAAFFHDLGMLEAGSRINEIESTPVEKLSPEDRDLYINHAHKGATILAQATETNSVILQAIRQHHERRNGYGLGGCVKKSDITPMAEIVGICDEFMHVLRESTLNHRVDPLQKMKVRVFDQFSFITIQAFSNIFRIKF